MSDADPHKCCVCSQPAANRCSACARAGIDRFFCSQEHQKLVYKVHKTLCGEKAKPFLLPPLSTAQLAAVEHNKQLQDVFEEYGTSTSTSLTWTSYLSYLAAPPPPGDAWQWLAMSLRMRQNIKAVDAMLPAKKKGDPSSVFAVFALIGVDLINAVEDAGLAGEAVLSEPWLVDGMHRMLVILTLVELVAMAVLGGSDLSSVEDMTEWASSLHGEIVDWASRDTGAPSGFKKVMLENLPPVDDL
ncbi:hypothetical protein JCM8097_007953 [Rhodosporidiobolus ruineniae]